jgi:hypothetical protein
MMPTWSGVHGYRSSIAATGTPQTPAISRRMSSSLGVTLSALTSSRGAAATLQGKTSLESTGDWTAAAAILFDGAVNQTLKE